MTPDPADIEPIVESIKPFLAGHAPDVGADLIEGLMTSRKVKVGS